MLTSLRAQTAPSCGIDVILIQDFLTAPLRSRIEKFVLNLPHSTLRWLHVDVAPIASAPLSMHFTRAAYARLLAFDALGEIDRLIYLDCDMICLADIRALWKLPLKGKVLGAVLDPHATFLNDGHTEALGLASGTTQFNSGVLLVDLALWRQRGLTATCLRFIREHPAAIRWVDQDVLNAVAQPWERLPSPWNVQTHFMRPVFFPRLQQQFPQDFAAVQTPNIVHFNDPEKPWHAGYQHPLIEAFHQYMKMSGWD
jgi:lipopolysaccharide biosynthesis glycosyltransferase